jgi:hypothetical protein
MGPTELKPEESVCAEADRIVAGDRRGDYGHPLDDFCRGAVLWSAIIGKQVSYKQYALCMDAVKTSREINKEKRDNRTDKCGYTKCLDMCYSEEKRRLADGWTFDPFTGWWHKPEDKKV